MRFFYDFSLAANSGRGWRSGIADLKTRRDTNDTNFRESLEWGRRGGKGGRGGGYDIFCLRKVREIRPCFAAKTMEYLGVKAAVFYHQDTGRAAGVAGQMLSSSRERKPDEM
jgi:hypothetical protein